MEGRVRGGGRRGGGGEVIRWRYWVVSGEEGEEGEGGTGGETANVSPEAVSPETRLPDTTVTNSSQFSRTFASTLIHLPAFSTILSTSFTSFPSLPFFFIPGTIASTVSMILTITAALVMVGRRVRYMTEEGRSTQLVVMEVRRRFREVGV